MGFDDHTEQVIDFHPVLAGELYGPLRELSLFRQVMIDPEIHTLVWPNGADFDPARCTIGRSTRRHSPLGRGLGNCIPPDISIDGLIFRCLIGPAQGRLRPVTLFPRPRSVGKSRCGPFRSVPPRRCAVWHTRT